MGFLFFRMITMGLRLAALWGAGGPLLFISYSLSPTSLTYDLTNFTAGWIANSKAFASWATTGFIFFPFRVSLLQQIIVIERSVIK